MSEQPKPTMSIRPPLTRQRMASQFVHDDEMVQAVEAAVATAVRKTRGGEKTHVLDDWRGDFNEKLRSVAKAIFKADERSEATSPSREAYLDAVQATWQDLSDHVELLRETYPHIAKKLPDKHDFIAHGPSVAQTALAAMALRVNTRMLDPRYRIEVELTERMGQENFANLKDAQEKRHTAALSTGAGAATTATPDNAVRKAIITLPGKNNTTWYAALISATHAAVNVLNQAQEGKASASLMSDLVQFETALNAYAQKLKHYRGNTQLSDAAFKTLKNAYCGLSFKLRREYGENLLSVDELDELRPAMREAALAVLPADPKASQSLKTHGTLRGPGAGDDLSGRGEGRG